MPKIANLPEGVADTFTFKCPWGCTVTVDGGQEQPHTCDGTSRILDILHTAAHANPSQSYMEMAERVARALDPALRERSHESWVIGVKDGRSGALFYGIDDEQINREGGRA